MAEAAGGRFAERDDGFWRRLKEEMKSAAPSFGIDRIGVASAEPFRELKERLARRRELGRDSGFEEPDLDKRTDPARVLPEARSIIAVAVAYPAKLRGAPVSAPGARRGVFSRSSWGEDYHRVVGRRLERLAGWLTERVPEARTLAMTDTGALVDRAVAERAGIGWSGKNCSIITPEFGSWVYLGELVTNLPLPPDRPIGDACGSCTRCLEACPTGALVGPGELDARRCISWLTQSKDAIDEPLMEKMGNRLYGCDTCQVVCPYNRGLDARHHEELLPDPEIVKPLLRPILAMGNREFKEKFGRSAGAWRGRKPIQRNALIALGHFRDRESAPDVVRVLREDPRPALRMTAAWALGRIGGAEAEAALREAAAGDAEPEVRAAAGRALARLAQAPDPARRTGGRGPKDGGNPGAAEEDRERSETSGK